ncbi:MAG: protein-glutamate O-methyltransferase CheR [Deltaproteobacteria bacterium]|nr:protein-glutamate O-methyltransferase CheR [Deltaproteobacteria bacterium]
MKESVFNNFKDLIAKESGIALTSEKKALLTTRIGKRLRKLGLNDAEEYLNIIQTDRSGAELERLIDAISTNVTHFFREISHFHFLENLLSEWRMQGKRKARVWCAASSTGEEPYSIAMTAAEVLDLNSFNFKLLASDICIDVLQKASLGVYETSRLKDVPQQMKSAYFSVHSNSHGEKLYKVKPHIRNLVTFKRINLSSFPLPLSGPIDVIFCRNVMIYFKLDLRAKLINEYYRLLTPGGYLVVGHSENLLGIQHEFISLKNTVYQKKSL